MGYLSHRLLRIIITTTIILGWVYLLLRHHLPHGDGMATICHHPACIAIVEIGIDGVGMDEMEDAAVVETDPDLAVVVVVHVAGMIEDRGLTVQGVDPVGGTKDDRDLAVAVREVDQGGDMTGDLGLGLTVRETVHVGGTIGDPGLAVQGMHRHHLETEGVVHVPDLAQAAGGDVGIADLEATVVIDIEVMDIREVEGTTERKTTSKFLCLP